MFTIRKFRFEVDLGTLFDTPKIIPLVFHGTLKLQAKVSQTMTGWKR